MPKKLTYEYIKEQIEVDGYKLLSTEYINSSIKLKIKCHKRHIYWASYSNFQQSKRCPKCAFIENANHQQLSYKFVKQEIEKVGYQLLSTSYKNNNTKIQIKCDKEHMYYTAYTKFQQGRKCPKCAMAERANKLSFSYDFIKREIEKDGYALLSDSYKNNNIKIRIRCDKGHIYDVVYSSFQQGHRCSICSCNGTSLMEKELQQWLSKYIDIECNKRFYYSGRKFHEADIYIPDKKLAIELDGLYYHSEQAGKDKNYHLNKTDFFEEQGVDLIHIFENEWLLKQDIVKSVILRKLNCISCLILKDYKIKYISQEIGKDFLDQNHIQGDNKSDVYLGLWSKNTLMSVMSFKNGNNYILDRFCDRIDVVVDSSFEKILNYFNHNNVLTYVDRRYNTNKLYINNNFKFVKYTKPNCWYFLQNKTGNSRDLSKVPFYGDNNKIFDCGNIILKYVGVYND